MNRSVDVYAAALRSYEKIDEAISFERKISDEIAQHDKYKEMAFAVPQWHIEVQKYLNEQDELNDLIDDSSPKLPEWYVAQEKVIDEITRILERPKAIQNSLIVLANNGWYFDFDLVETALFELAEAFDGDDCKNVELALAEYFQSERVRIKDFLIDQFPNRRLILESAFEAHEHEKYVLSIPVLMAQIDGMCKEKTNASFFTGSEQSDLSKSLSTLVKESYLGLFVAPIEEKTTIRMSRADRLKFIENNSQVEFKELNRHLVLHGECIVYGTYLNSLKMISLAYYLVRVLTCSPA